MKMLRHFCIGFNSILQPIFTNSKFVSEGFTIYKYKHPCPRTSHRIRKTSQTTLNGEKREETFRRATEEDPSPGWTGVIDVMCTEGIILCKLKHSNNTINEYDSVWVVGRRPIPRSRPRWSIRQIGSMTSHRVHRSQKDAGEEAELIMCNREMKIHS